MLEIKKEDIKEYKVNKKSRKKRPSKPKKFLKELAERFCTPKQPFNFCCSNTPFCLPNNTLYYPNLITQSSSSGFIMIKYCSNVT